MAIGAPPPSRRLERGCERSTRTRRGERLVAGWTARADQDEADRSRNQVADTRRVQRDTGEMDPTE